MIISSHWTFRSLSAMVAASFFFIGFKYALGASSHIDDFSLSEQEGHSSLSIIADAPPQIKLSYDKSSRTLTIRLISTTGTEIFDGFEYSDSLIDSVYSGKDEQSGDTLLKISFNRPNISFNTTSASGQPGVTLIFRPVDKPLRIKGVTPERLMARIRQPRETEPGKEPVSKQEALKEIERAVAETGKPESKEARRLLAQIDEKYRKMEAEAGRIKYVEIMTNFRKSQWREAAAAANELIKFYPKSIYRESAYFTRAESLYMLSKFEDKSAIPKAIEAYNTAIAMYPNSPLVQQGLMHKGNLYAEQNFYIEALTEYGGLLRIAPKGKYGVPAMLVRGKIFLKQKKYQRAYNELEKILILFPSNREVRDVKYLIAESYFERGMYKIAADIFKEAMKQWPTYPKSHPNTFIIIAETNYRLGNLKEAMEDWFTIVNLFPSSFEARRAMLWVGDVYSETDRKKEAAEIYERVIIRYPKNDESVLAKMRLASLGAENPELLKHSRVFDYSAFENPFKTLNNIIKKNPMEKFVREALMRKGKAYSIQKRYVAAIVAFKELLRTIPSARMSDEVFDLVRANFLKMIGSFYEQDGFFMVLLTYYNNFEPFLRGIEEPGILIKIADSYSRMTLHGRAIEYYRLANKFDEKRRLLPETAFRIAKATLDKKDIIKAARLLRRYSKDFPKTAYTLKARHLLGDALYELGRLPEAATEWRLVMEADINHPRVSRSAYNLASTFKGEKQYLMAIDAYNLAIDSYKPTGDSEEDQRYIKDSFYQVAESHYLDRDYPNAIREAEIAKIRFPGDGRNSWMDYIISASYERINKDEMAIASLKRVSESDSGSTIGKVASSKLKNFEWKRKNRNLFFD